MYEKLCSDLKNALNQIKSDQIIFLCIGTDRSTGDAYGPLIGTQLQALGYPVIGTIDDPCHALNIEQHIADIPKDITIIAIDACLGSPSSVGKITAKKGAIKPGAGVGKDLPAVGDIAIAGVVNVGGFMEYFVLQNTRLSLVTSMADVTVKAIREVIPFPAMQEVAATKKRESLRSIITNSIKQFILLKAR